MRAALLALAVLAGCQPESGPGRATGLALVPAPGGVRVAGSGGLEIGFGRDRAGVLQSVSKVEGRAPTPVPCGAGRDAVATADGLRLIFEGKRFVGWDGAGASAGRGCA